MLKKSLIFALTLTFGTAGHAAGPSTLGPNAVMTGGDYTTGGGLTVAIEARQINGRLGLCGIWAQSSAMSVYTRRVAPSVLARGVATLNGQVIARNLNFLNRVAPAPSYTGAPTGCIVTNRPWRPADANALQIRIPRQKIRDTSTARLRDGPRVFFTRSDIANPAMKKGSLLPAYVTNPGSGASQY